jgi:hypothetical protein
MIADFTRQQLSELSVPANRPLIICDVDDVVVHFLKGFDTYLSSHDHVLELKSFALGGNVFHRHTRAEMSSTRVSELVDDYFRDFTEHMETIDQSIESLVQLGEDASVVMLTNLPHHARDKRIRNLQKHGLPFPVITNQGPKGPAIRELASRTTAPSVFVDDSPNFIQSSYEVAPEVKIIHFLHDERLATIHTPFDFVAHTSRSWAETKPQIEALIG